MRVLYGVQGTGNGHITRSRLIVCALAARGVAVDVLVSGRAADAVPTFDGAASVMHRTGLSFVVEAGQLSKTKTVTQLELARFVSDVRSLDLSRYDQLITDYEAVTAWAAKLRRRRVIGVGHQYAFGEGTPEAESDLASRMVMRCFAPVSVGLGLHWAHYHSNVLPPVVDLAALNRADPSGVTVVYLPWEDTAAVTAALNGIPDRLFHKYCHVEEATEIGNVTLCPISYTGFKTDLCGADAVICNAGFELVSEALHLGVPVCVKPLAGQFEQQSNALALQQAGLAGVFNAVTPEAIEAALIANAGAATQRYPDVAGAVADWLCEEPATSVATLARSLWINVVGDLSQCNAK